MGNVFHVGWKVEVGWGRDGWSGHADHYTAIYSHDIKEDMSKKDIEDLIDRKVQQSFERTVEFSVNNFDECVSWCIQRQRSE